MGQLTPCSVCRKRPDEKPSQVTWAWNPSPRERVAYRQKLCFECFCARVMRFNVDYAKEGSLTCPTCGIDVEFDMEPIYCTSFLPGVGKLTYEIPLCGGCAAVARAEATENAELLPERDPASRGLAPGSAPRASVWSSLGIVPNEP
jgi:hypothetical protein